MKLRLLSTLAAACTLTAATLPTSKPEDAGMSAERLARVNQLIDRYIQKGEIAGAVSLVARRGRVVHFEAQGVADIATKKPMAKDTIFRLASMTKPVTSLAVMMLHEQGQFLLDDPVSKFLPEFAEMKVAVANAPNERFGPGYRLVPAERPITIRHLLSHTAGLASGTAGPTMEEYKKLMATRKPTDTLAEFIPKLAKLPLNFHPGAAWEYGPSVDVLGRLVEVISGQPLDAYFRKQIFDPLAMPDTWFYLPSDRVARLASNYKKENGALVKLTNAGPENPNGKYFAGGGGLAGTAEDYFRLCQMFMNGWRLENTRLVSRKSVEAMTANQIGEHNLWFDSYKNYKFGLGFRVRNELGQTGTLGSVGEYGWGGAHGTYFFIDPKEQLIGILMIQLNPYSHINLRPEFQNVATQAIVD
jgi:CubicO group peptidase (beta-lactamase class C family)